MAPESGPVEIRGLARRLRRTAPELRSLGLARRARALGAAAELLANERDALGRALRIELADSTGLSPASIAWGLETTCETVRAVDLAALVGSEAEPGPELVAMILAGNVFSACLRPIALALSVGVPVLAKASSRDDVLSRYLKKALTLADADVGRSFETVTHAHGNAALDAAVIGHADLVSVYGSDETIDAVRALVPPGTGLSAHGHGFGAAYVSQGALRRDARAVAASLAVDVAAYDQRGCLSAQVIFVEHGPTGAGDVARLLAAEALPDAEARYPRGRLPPEAAAAQMQWRGVARARGTLHEGAAFAVSHEGGCDPRTGPGYRNVGVYDCAGLDALREQLVAFGVHLKCLGLTDDLSRDVVAGVTAARVCSTGRMQRPGLREPLDGLHPLDGLIRQRKT